MKKQAIARHGGPKRAGIYIRVSSEEQAGPDKASPGIQEKDARARCTEKGYVVADVYKDIERYRVGGKLVEPSGTRSDRPGYLQMLADVDAGKLDVIVPWRVDRLYRGINMAFIELQNRVEKKLVEVESVKDHYDPMTAGFLAAAARVELHAKHERLIMGIRGRLAKGKAWNMLNPLGYKLTDGTFEIAPDEAKWVESVWKWYAGDVPVREIRRRLIAGSAPQRRNGGKHQWKLSYVRDVLHHTYYSTGIFQTKVNGEVFEIHIPAIVDAATAKRVERRFKRYKAYPSGNAKTIGLASGLAYCEACNVKMQTVNKTSLGHNKTDSKVRRYRYHFYICGNQGLHVPGCAHLVKTDRVDADLWARVWGVLSDRAKFKRSIEERIKQLQAIETNAEVDCERLQGRLETVLAGRQKVIDWALAGTINDSDMKTRLQVMDAEREEMERELSEKQLLVGNRSARLIELAEIYRAQVQAGTEGINEIPETPEQAKLQFEARRKIVERLVTRVTMRADKSIQVQTEIDLSRASVTRPTSC